MIDEKKLMCIFIYSALSSGSCGLAHQAGKREEYLDALSRHIGGKGDFPKDQIEEYQQEMLKLAGKCNSFREYAYSNHLDAILNEFKEKFNTDLKTIVSYPKKYEPLYVEAKKCPVSFYKVLENNGKEIVAEDLFFNEKKILKRLDGLENPNLGDLVSGHWGYFLEIVNDVKGLDNYRKKTSDYFNIFKLNK
ncbi:MAG: hypothetical protein ACP5OG_05745 [Candidatus Nanoarchaeia archaeon]